MSEQQDTTYFEADRLLKQIRVGIAYLIMVSGFLLGTIAVAALQAATIGVDPVVMGPVFLAASYGAVLAGVGGVALLFAEEFNRVEQWLQTKWAAFRGSSPSSDDREDDRVAEGGEA